MADLGEKVNAEALKMASEFEIGYKAAKGLSNLAKETMELEQKILKSKRKLLKSDIDWQARMHGVQEKIKKAQETHQNKIDKVMETFVDDMKKRNIASEKWNNIFEKNIAPKIEDMAKAHDKELGVYESRRKLEEKMYKGSLQMYSSSKMLNSAISGAVTGLKGLGKFAKSIGSSLFSAIGNIAKGGGIATGGPLTNVIIFFLENLMKSEQVMADLVQNTGFLRSQLGGVGKATMNTYVQLARFGVDIDQVNTMAAALVSEFGTVGDTVTGLIKNATLWSKAFNIAESDMASFLDLMVRGLGRSNDEIDSFVKMLAGKARTAGVSVNHVMQDVAKHTELVAMYSDKSGKNIANAAVYAKRLGVNLSVVESLSNKFLTLDSALESTMELNLVAGTNFNAMTLHRLAMTGDLVGLQTTLLDKLKIQGIWESKNALQRKLMADDMGMSVVDLSKMITQSRIFGRSLKDIATKDAAIEKQMSDAMTWWDEIIYAVKAKFLPYLIQAGQYLNSKIKPITSNLADIFSKWAPSIKDVMNALATWDFSKVEQDIKTMAGKLSDALKDAFGMDKNKGWIDSIWESLSKSPKLNALEKSISDMFSHMFEQLYDRLPGWMQWLIGSQQEASQKKAIETISKYQGDKTEKNLEDAIQATTQRAQLTGMNVTPDMIKQIRESITKSNMGVNPQGQAPDVNDIFKIRKISGESTLENIEKSLQSIDAQNKHNSDLDAQIAKDNDRYAKDKTPIPLPKGLAKGGLVTKPTRALIGEAGPELIIPLGRNSGPSGSGYKFGSGGLIAPISRGRQGVHIDPSIRAILGQITGARTGSMGAQQDYADPAAIRQREKEYVQEQNRYQKELLRELRGSGNGRYGFGRSIENFVKGIRNFANSVKRYTGIDLIATWKQAAKDIAKNILGPTLYGVIDRGTKAVEDIRNALHKGGAANWMKAAGSTANILNPNATKTMKETLLDPNKGLKDLFKSAGSIFNIDKTGQQTNLTPGKTEEQMVTEYQDKILSGAFKNQKEAIKALDKTNKQILDLRNKMYATSDYKDLAQQNAAGQIDDAEFNKKVDEMAKTFSPSSIGNTKSIIHNVLAQTASGLKQYGLLKDQANAIQTMSKGIILDKETIDALGGKMGQAAQAAAIGNITMQQLDKGNWKEALAAQAQPGGKLFSLIRGVKTGKFNKEGGLEETGMSKFRGASAEIGSSMMEGFAKGGVKGALKAGISKGYDMASDKLMTMGPYGQAAGIAMKVFKKPLGKLASWAGKKLFGIDGRKKLTIKSDWNSSLLASLKSHNPAWVPGHGMYNDELVPIANQLFPYGFQSMEDIAASGFLGQEDRSGAIKKGGMDLTQSAAGQGYASGGVVYTPQTINVGENGPEVITPLSAVRQGLWGGGKGSPVAGNNNEMLLEIKGLRADIQTLSTALMNRPMRINMDGRKVADVVSERFEELART